METYPQTRWDLTELLKAPTGEPLERTLQEIESRTANFEQARAKLKPDIDEEEFLDIVHEFDGLNRVLRKIGLLCRIVVHRGHAKPKRACLQNQNRVRSRPR